MLPRAQSQNNTVIGIVTPILLSSAIVIVVMPGQDGILRTSKNKCADKLVALYYNKTGDAVNNDENAHNTGLKIITRVQLEP